MAMTTCPDCARDVSSTAAACPWCGRPIRKPVVTVRNVVGLVVLLFVGWYLVGTVQATGLLSDGHSAVRAGQ